MANMKRVVLSDRTHCLPMPDRNYENFPKTAAGRVVDIESPFYLNRLRDGSVKLAGNPPKAKAKS